mgnify:CR=1 FL=1
MTQHDFEHRPVYDGNIDQVYGPITQQHMTKNTEVKPPFNKISEEQQIGMNVVEFSKFEEVIKSSYGETSTGMKSYLLNVSWRDFILTPRILDDRLTQMRKEVLGKGWTGPIEVYCKFLFIRFDRRYYF